MASQIDNASVEEALGEVLASPSFRATAQCSELLRYIVTNTLVGRDENLRERVIGCKVFHRAPDYDTGNDHVVRSRAAEVRKRLALYYQEVGPSTPVRISVPSGSYRAVFELPKTDSNNQSPAPVLKLIDPRAIPIEAPSTAPAVTETAVIPSRRSFAWKVSLAFAALVGLASAFALLWPHRSSVRPRTDYARFWAPLLESAKPPLIYCGGGFVYKLSDAYLDHYKSEHNIAGQRREFFVDLKPVENRESSRPDS